MFVDRPNGSSWMTGCGGLTIVFAGRGRMTATTSSRSSPEWTPLDPLDVPDDVSDGARSGGDVELSVDVVSDRGVSKESVGTPESARRKQRGVEVRICKRRFYHIEMYPTTFTTA